MTTTAQKQEVTKQDKFTAFIMHWKAKHDDAMRAVHRSVEVTSAEWWKQRYGDVVGNHQRTKDMLIESIEGVLATIKMHGSSEDLEKDIKDSAKSLAENRERFAAINSSMFDPHRRAVNAAIDVREACIREAKSQATQAPLQVDSDMVARVEEAIAEWPKAAFNEETGQVTID